MDLSQDRLLNSSLVGGRRYDVREFCDQCLIIFAIRVKF
ncbi:hypothetical protein LEP1GSC047_3063 [Leptospira inadai serovar Lyme str. 10]|uniref:Uncharacterized protein n=1 Tax=Leptospira inadai serovar Lyme str. 10 TaxID=1049790 RepID=V6HV86_9LEPT|nr:hypothetical protein LEP1GSC047_3063 [Leptospira inadai serovar Lyme str. 10]